MSVVDDEQHKSTTMTNTTSTTTTTPEQQQFALPPHFTFAPPGAFPPTFFAYPAPPELQQSENASTSGVPPPFQLVYGPPGMVFAFPPPVASANTPLEAAKPKRKQVKMACTNCAAACKRCDDARPCERCRKFSLEDSCMDGQRKERKKGVKRGPYRRKNKDIEGFEFAPESSASTMQAVPQLPPPPEGFYPLYYPNHLPTEGNEGTSNGHPPPMMPVYLAGFPTYPYAPPPGAMFMPSPGTHLPQPPPPSLTVPEGDTLLVPEPHTDDHSVGSSSQDDLETNNTRNTRKRKRSTNDGHAKRDHEVGEESED